MDSTELNFTKDDLFHRYAIRERLRVQCDNPSKFRYENKCLYLCQDYLRMYPGWYTSYTEWSYIVNCFLMLAIILIGCFGNALLLWRMRNAAKVRLNSHIRMLCLWDSLTMLAMCALIAIPCVISKTVEIYGTNSYVIRICLPFANMAATGSLWQIMAICAERAFGNKNDNGNGNKSPKWVCVLIAIGTILLHVPMFLESTMDECFLIRDRRVYPCIVPSVIKSNIYYTWLVDRIPELIFKSVTPLLLMVILTVCTMCNSSRRWVLTLLGVKCIASLLLPAAYDMLVMFNLLQQKQKLYLADASNILLTLQRATNWLIFIKGNNPSSPPTSTQKEELVRATDPKNTA